MMPAKPVLYIISDHVVVNKIYEIRGQKVMLDSDLAELYGVPTKVLNQAIKRNTDRFPDDFMFQLTDREWQNLKSQIVTSSWGGKRKPPFVFTEHGVLMLSSVLNSPQAIQVNIQIVRIFSRLRQLLNDQTGFKFEIEEIKRQLNNHDKNLDLVFKCLDKLMEKKALPRKWMGYMPDEL